MNNDELLNRPTDAGRHVEPGGDAYDDEISLQPLLRTLWLYRQVMSLAVAGVMACFVVGMLAAYVFQAVERLGTLEFRLLFEGASQGQYPNGTLFSSAEITSTSVLTEVFETPDRRCSRRMTWRPPALPCWPRALCYYAVLRLGDRRLHDN